MMPFLAVSHSIRWLPGKFIQPEMDFGIRFPKCLQCLGAVLFKSGHDQKRFDSMSAFSNNSVGVSALTCFIIANSTRPAASASD